MKQLTIGKNDAGQRLDKFLTKNLPNLPQSLLYKYIRKKRIKVNGKRAEISTRLSEGDVLDLYINDEFFEKPEPTYDFLHAGTNLNILFEDENVLVLDKPVGLLAHPDDREYVDTLIGRVKRYLYEKGEYDPEAEQSFTPALVNRIDRNTGGLVIAAKTSEALRRVNEAIREGRVDRRYLCAVHGIPQKREAALTSYLIKNADENLVTVSRRPVPGARTAVTKYKLLATSPDSSLALLECTLLTGRTHQIRAQLADAGHPLLGDGKYGINKNDRTRGYSWQALYSYRLTLEGKTHSAEISNIRFLKEFPDFKL